MLDCHTGRLFILNDARAPVLLAWVAAGVCPRCHTPKHSHAAAAAAQLARATGFLLCCCCQCCDCCCCCCSPQSVMPSSGLPLQLKGRGGESQPGSWLPGRCPSAEGQRAPSNSSRLSLGELCVRPTRGPAPGCGTCAGAGAARGVAGLASARVAPSVAGPGGLGCRDTMGPLREAWRASGSPCAAREVAAGLLSDVLLERDVARMALAGQSAKGWACNFACGLGLLLTVAA